MRDIAYQLTQDAPLDLTFQGLLSGQHFNLGKRMDVTPGVSKVYFFYGGLCLGVAPVADISTRKGRTLNAWSGKLRAMTSAERDVAYATYKRHSGNLRGGAYACDG